MKDRNERDERTERRSGEGVRIIRPEEAQAAIDTGQAAGRRSEDELRFGDVPPTPPGPRPPHRFPLPDSVDPAVAVPRPPVVQPARSEHAAPVARGRAVRAEEAHDSRPWQERKGPAPPAPEPVGPELDRPGAVEPELGSMESDPQRGRRPEGVAFPEAGAGPPDDEGAPRQGAMAMDPVEAVRDADPDPTAVLPAARATSAPASPPGAPGPVMATPEPEIGGWAQPEQAVRQEPTWAHPVSTGPVPPPQPPIGRSEPTEGTGPGAGQPDPSPVAQEHAQEALLASPPPAYEGPWSERPASFSSGSPQPSVLPAAAWTPSGSGWTPSGSGWTPHPPSPEGAGSVEPDPDRTELDPPDEGMTVTGGFGTELPHWTDPPTGEVPRIRPEPADEDDLAAWEALGAQGTRWRDDTTGGWDNAPELSDLADDEAPIGALDQSRTEHSDLYSFDEDFERLEEERSGSHRAISADPEAADFDEFADLDDADRSVSVGGRPPRTIRSRPPGAPRQPRPPRRDVAGGGAPGGGTGPDLGSRVGVGVGLVVLLLIAYAVGPVALLVLATAVVVAAAVEVYGMLQRSGFRPATLLGLVATVGLMFGAYWRGIGALPLIVGLVFVASMLWYLLGIVEARPLANVAVTITAFMWVGVLGSFAALLLRSQHGKGLFLGAVLPAVVADIVAYFVGRQMGSRPLAPRVSPTKTLEGAIGGGIAAIIVGIIIGHSVSPWGGIKHGLLLGVVVAVLAPTGDLFESMIKRDLDVKDSGSLLSGHGGVLDRFDSVLLVLPAAFYLASFFGVLR